MKPIGLFQFDFPTSQEQIYKGPLFLKMKIYERRFRFGEADGE